MFAIERYYFVTVFLKITNITKMDRAISSTFSNPRVLFKDYSYVFFTHLRPDTELGVGVGVEVEAEACTCTLAFNIQVFRGHLEKQHQLL